MSTSDAPLAGYLVLDMAQFLSGPSAALRLADLGARVIKIERPGSGDICRTLYLTDTDLGGDSTLFHSINRGKESFAADLKDPGDCADVMALLARADVVIQNFRPGVAERLGFGYPAVRARNPGIVYATISGYGEDGPWAGFPGQDLLAQALSGAMWLSGSEGHGPVPFGLAVADMLAGHAIVEGVLAALLRRSRSGQGAQVQTSLLEAMIDLQFEVLTTHLNDGGRQPLRPAVDGAHAYLAAPYGVYPTLDGFLALAMTPLATLAPLLGLSALADAATRKNAGFLERDALKRLIATRLAGGTTAFWLGVLRAADIWCAPVMDWPTLLNEDAFTRLEMLHSVTRTDGTRVTTTRSPLRLDGQRLSRDEAAPTVGQHTAAIRTEFALMGNASLAG